MRFKTDAKFFTAKTRISFPAPHRGISLSLPLSFNRSRRHRLITNQTTPPVKSKPIATTPPVPIMGNSSSSRAKDASKSTEAAVGGKVNHKKFGGARGRKSSPTKKGDRVLPTATAEEEPVLVPHAEDDDISYDTESDDEYDSDEESVDEGKWSSISRLFVRSSLPSSRASYGDTSLPCSLKGNESANEPITPTFPSYWRAEFPS